ncbi:MAG: hypothetical protein ACKPKO_06730, partial [Candidatus Fonsibacter sp.]
EQVAKFVVSRPGGGRLGPERRRVDKLVLLKLVVSVDPSATSHDGRDLNSQKPTLKGTWHCQGPACHHGA